MPCARPSASAPHSARSPAASSRTSGAAPGSASPRSSSAPSAASSGSGSASGCPTEQGRLQGMATIVAFVRRAVAFLRAHPKLTKTLQWLLVAATVVFCAWAVKNQWHKAKPRLENAQPGYLILSFLVVAAYYLVFILGW